MRLIPASGGSGGIGGSTGATDNAILRADGAGGATAQGSAAILTDAGVLQAPFVEFAITVNNVTQADDPFDIPTSWSARDFQNGGATASVQLTLPDPPARVGVWFMFTVLAAQNMVIQAPTGVTLRIGASATSSGGTLTSNVVGSKLLLMYENSTTWAALMSGTWVAT